MDDPIKELPSGFSWIVRSRSESETVEHSWPIIALVNRVGWQPIHRAVSDENGVMRLTHSKEQEIGNHFSGHGNTINEALSDVISKVKYFLECA